MFELAIGYIAGVFTGWFAAKSNINVQDVTDKSLKRVERSWEAAKNAWNEETSSSESAPEQKQPESQQTETPEPTLNRAEAQAKDVLGEL